MNEVRDPPRVVALLHTRTHAPTGATTRRERPPPPPLMRSTLAILALPLALGLPVALHAQAELDSLAPGTRVRIFLPDSLRQPGQSGSPALLLRGTLTRQRADTLFLALAPGVGEVAVTRGALRRVDVSRGMPSRLESAGAEAVRVGLLYALLSTITYVTRTDDGTADRLSYPQHVGVSVGLGFVTGGIVGAIWPRERWRRVLEYQGAAR